MDNKEFSEYMKAQVDAFNLAKWYEGERIGRDPGDEFIRQLLKNGSAEAFRESWEENHGKV